MPSDSTSGKRVRSAPSAERFAAALSRIAGEADAPISRKYNVELVTPMYGGGVEAGKTDLAMPIRAASIRGQLRFWWRILFARTLTSQETFESESKIWGGIAQKGPRASSVHVRVRQATADARLEPAPKKPTEKHAYAFGPALASSEQESPRLLSAGYKFELLLRYPDSEKPAKEIEEAFQWWARFGGVGARTRRGFGAVAVEGLPDQSCAAAQNAAARIGAVLRFAKTPSGSAERVWDAAVEKLKTFRQQSVKDGEKNRWPEADQLRRFEFARRRRRLRREPDHEAGNVFPRAAFGLPIIFQFKDSNEPNEQTLLPRGGADRMASPLILRPYWDGESWYAAALLLPHWREALKQPLQFKSSRDRPERWPDDESERTHLAGLIAPMKTADGALRGADPLSAFLEYFAE